MALLEVKKLSVTLSSHNTIVLAVRDVNLHINEGEAVALVGESGCGKSRTAFSLLGLHEKSAKITVFSADFSPKITKVRPKYVAWGCIQDGVVFTRIR